MKEINATFTKKQNLLCNRNKGKRIIREGNFVSGTFWCKRSQVKKSGYFIGVLHSFTVTGKSPPC